MFYRLRFYGEKEDHNLELLDFLKTGNPTKGLVTWQNAKQKNRSVSVNTANARLSTEQLVVDVNTSEGSNKSESHLLVENRQ